MFEQKVLKAQLDRDEIRFTKYGIFVSIDLKSFL
jgi:hypothetical protein